MVAAIWWVLRLNGANGLRCAGLLPRIPLVAAVAPPAAPSLADDRIARVEPSAVNLVDFGLCKPGLLREPVNQRELIEALDRVLRDWNPLLRKERP